VSPVVSLDVLPADVPAEYAPAMVAACSDALTDGRCAMAQTLPESTQPEAVALVLWQGDGFLQVTVRVGRGGGQWVARALTFSERDSLSERWTTVGLTVATLVGETRALDSKGRDDDARETPAQPVSPTAAALTPAPTIVKPADVGPPPAARPSAPPPRWQGRFGAVTGPGWESGNWLVGSWLSWGFRVSGTPLVLNALASYALSNGPNVGRAEVSTRWATVGVGAGLTGTWSALDLAGSAVVEVAYRRIDVDYRGQAAGDQEVPISLRALVSYPAGSELAVTGGVAVRVPPGNRNESSDLRVRVPAISGEVVAGLEVRL
jgi:hypothetical protein